jgi:hypothetical protein
MPRWRKAGVNAQLKVPALVAGMVAGADSIEDMDLLRHGGMERHGAAWSGCPPACRRPRRWPVPAQLRPPGAGAPDQAAKVAAALVVILRVGRPEDGLWTVGGVAGFGQALMG